MPTDSAERQSSCAVVIVTHNSEAYLSHAIDSLKKQTKCPDRIIIVDNASTDRTYLQIYRSDAQIELIFTHENTGFCKGNNIGFQAASSFEYILFLNPDAFLTPPFIENALRTMQKQGQCGALTGMMLAYDINEQKPTGKCDSTGVFSTFYGHWYDRDQGKGCHALSYRSLEPLPAICGALMFCRTAALQAVYIHPGEVFDSSFFMYKEDIDLSLRLKKKGWNLLFCPNLTAYHCRGWKKRSKIPRFLRLLSAKNELRIHRRLGSPLKTTYSLVKYLAVLALDL